MTDKLVTEVEVGGIEAVHLRLTYEEYKALKAFLGSTSYSSRLDRIQGSVTARLLVDPARAADTLGTLYQRMPQPDDLKDY